ncbi:hypothetical protein ZWY2020_014838 [Hordeum vulgare]|nr:hypothetical protein ZWY2020_014838 [Hordeum vulgare]
MAEAASAGAAGATPVVRGIPEEILIWEILVRLPPKSLLRCHAVCRAWRTTTCARAFLLAHHDRQPARPLVYACDLPRYRYYKIGGSLEINPFDHRPAAAAVGVQLESIARLDRASYIEDLVASFDGLVLVRWGISQHTGICNPVTRQYAPFLLPMYFRFFRLLLLQQKTFQRCKK